VNRLLSVVVPAFNEAQYIDKAMRAIRAAVEAAELGDTEVTLVDDGSDDRTVDVAMTAFGNGLSVMSRPRSGRFASRLAGISASTGRFVLVVDARVELDPLSLVFWRRQLSTHPNRVAWKGDIRPSDESNPYATFQRALARRVWPAYRGELISYGPSEFDSFPKGTDMFMAPREIWIAAMNGKAEGASMLPSDLISDDTGTLRGLIHLTGRIWLSPEFGGTYTSNRTTLRSFVRSARYRGGTSIDGYAGQRTSLGILAWVVPSLAIVALIATGVALAVRPIWAGGIVLAGVIALGVATIRAARHQGLPWNLALVMALLAFPYAIGFIAGMWRGWFHRLRRMW
jgi:hypothetical protein